MNGFNNFIMRFFLAKTVMKDVPTEGANRDAAFAALSTGNLAGSLFVAHEKKKDVLANQNLVLANQNLQTDLNAEKLKLRFDPKYVIDQIIKASKKDNADEILRHIRVAIIDEDIFKPEELTILIQTADAIEDGGIKTKVLETLKESQGTRG